jgi:hypothetical protein
MKRSIRWIAVAVFVFAARLAYPQESHHAAYFELGGSAVVASVNYEQRVNENWYGRAGLSWVRGESGDQTATTFIIPLTASWVSRPQANHHLEVGGGLTVAAGDRQDLYGVSGDDKYAAVLATGIVGYRYQKPAGGFQFRAVLTPVVGSGIAAPWAGVSFGYAW